MSGSTRESKRRPKPNAYGVRIGSMDEHRMRAVTHLDVDAAGVEEAAQVLRVIASRG